MGLTMNIQLVNKGYGVGELLQGFVCITTPKRVIMTHLHFNLQGETVMSTNANDKKSPKTNYNFFLSRNYPPLAEQLSHSTEPYYHELVPGSHFFPFSITIPIVSHPSIHFINGVGVYYTLIATLQTLKTKDDEKIKEEFPTYTTAVEVPILFCIADMVNYPVKESCSRDGVLVKLQIEQGVVPNQDATVLVTVSNNTRTPFRPLMMWYSEHLYRETYIQSHGGILELEEVPKLLQKTYTIDTSKLFPTIEEDDFNVKSYVELRVQIKKKPVVSVKVPLHVGWSKMKEEVNRSRSELVGIEYTPDKVAFYGNHMRPTPECGEVIERFENNGNAFYVNHLWRKCYEDERCTNFLDVRYPLPEIFNLPKGWGMGCDRGELYFINWNKKYTTWIDPRTFEQRNVKALTLLVTVLKGRNFPVFKGKEAQFYGMAIDKNNTPVKTGISSKGADPIWTEENVLTIQNDEERENIVILFFANKKCVGGIDLPTWRVSKNGVEEWYQLKNFCDFGIPQTGEVLMRFMWEGDAPSTQPQRIQMRFEPFYCNTEATKEQEKYINKLRTKKGENTIEFKVGGDLISGKKGLYQESGVCENNLVMGKAMNYDVESIGSQVMDESFVIPKDEEEIKSESKEKIESDEKKEKVSTAAKKMQERRLELENSLRIIGLDKEKVVSDDEEIEKIIAKSPRLMEANKENKNNLEIAERKSETPKKDETITNKPTENDEDDEVQELMKIMEKAKKEEEHPKEKTNLPPPTFKKEKSVRDIINLVSSSTFDSDSDDDNIYFEKKMKESEERVKAMQETLKKEQEEKKRIEEMKRKEIEERKKAEEEEKRRKEEEEIEKEKERVRFNEE
ncbi:hypothetical protein EIN_492810, partial [Entamoeba invadens IP1]